MGNQYSEFAFTALANTWQDRLRSRRVYCHAAEHNGAEFSNCEKRAPLVSRAIYMKTGLVGPSADFWGAWRWTKRNTRPALLVTSRG